MDAAFPVNHQTENLCFCLNIKHNPGCPNEEHDEVFKHFHKNIMVYPRSKENLHWPVIGKALRVGKNLSNARCWWISLVCSKCSWWASGGNRDARKNVQFFPSFKLRNSIFRTLSDTKLLFKYKHFFYLKTGSLILNCVSLCSTNMLQKLCFKNYPHNLTKYEISETSKIPISQLVIGSYSKKTIFHLFHELEKIEKSS